MRPQKITFGDMREMGVRGVLVYCTTTSNWSRPSCIAAALEACNKVLADPPKRPLRRGGRATARASHIRHC
jgi:hypothetical protein